MSEQLEPIYFTDESGLDPSWRNKAACKGLDPAMFHTERGESVKNAVAVCAGCVVVKECLHYALSNGIKVGIYGGTSERQRRKLRRKINVANTQVD